MAFCDWCHKPIKRSKAVRTDEDEYVCPPCAMMEVECELNEVAKECAGR